MIYPDQFGKDLKEATRNGLRKSPTRMKEGLAYVNKLLAERGLAQLSPSEYLAQWGFEEPEITELLKKAGYVV